MTPISDKIPHIKAAEQAALTMLQCQRPSINLKTLNSNQQALSAGRRARHRKISIHLEHQPKIVSIVESRARTRLINELDAPT